MSSKEMWPWESFEDWKGRQSFLGSHLDGCVQVTVPSQWDESLAVGGRGLW